MSEHFREAWYHDVPRLMQQTDILYERLVKLGKPDKLTLTVQKMIEERKWEPNRLLIEKNLRQALTDLQTFYIPKVFSPGPMFVFPERDVDGNYTRAQTKPLYELLKDQRTGKPAKYVTIGVSKEKFKGPVWFGNDRATLERIVKLRTAVLIEGPFDLIACRALSPQCPTLSSVTKSFGEQHIAYLRMLGVERLYLLFDNEAPKKDKDAGDGNIAMRYLQRNIKSMDVEVLLSPSEDASKCLQNITQARALRSQLNSVLRRFAA